MVYKGNGRAVIPSDNRAGLLRGKDVTRAEVGGAWEALMGGKGRIEEPLVTTEKQQVASLMS